MQHVRCPYGMTLKDHAQGAGGFSVLIILLIILMVALAGLGFLTFMARMQIIETKDSTQTRLTTIRRALEMYYLSHGGLPQPVASPPGSVPTKALYLPQKFRLDTNGKFLYYHRIPQEGAVDILGLRVHERRVAAVLVAPGPDGVIAESNLESPYADPADDSNDDLVLGIPLEAEARKNAQRAVTLLQRTAQAYDEQFLRINNDGSRLDEFPEAYHFIPGNSTLNGTVGNRTVPLQPILVIDEGNDEFDGNYTIFQESADCIQLGPPEFRVTYTQCEWGVANGRVPAQGGKGEGCVRYGLLDNDPVRGTFTLDDCPTETATAADIANVFGLGLQYAQDPWGNAYLWGSRARYSPSDRRYWTFFSRGPDGFFNTGDDITPPERLASESPPALVIYPTPEE